MKRYNPKRIGLGIAAVALLFCALVGRQKSGVSANERKADFQPLLSERTIPLPPEAATVPSGTKIHIRLKDAISTEKNSSGDYFTASLDGPLMVGTRLLSPSRNRIIGQLTNVKDPGPLNGPTKLTMVLRRLTVNGKEYKLETRPLTLISPISPRTEKETGDTLIVTRIDSGSGAEHEPASAGIALAYAPSSQFTFTLSAPVELPVIRIMGGRYASRVTAHRREAENATTKSDTAAGPINFKPGE